MSTLSEGLPTPRRYWAMVTMLLGLVVTVLDISITNIALPTIARDLDIPADRVVWVSIAYSLAVVMTLLPLSTVADRIGYRPLFAIGLTISMLASTACALAPSFAFLVAARVVFGVGSSMVMCLLGGLVRNIYPVRQIGMGVSLNSFTVACMAVLGPTLGALILDVVSWRWVFVISVPLCALGLLGVRQLPDLPRVQRGFDWRACLLSMTMFGLLVIGLDVLSTLPGLALMCLLAGGVAGVFLLRGSLGQTAPMVPVDLLRLKPVGFAIAASLLIFAGQTGAFVAMPFYFLDVRGFSYAQVGVLLGAWALGTAIMAPLAGFLANRYRTALLCTVGATALVLGLILTLSLSVSVASQAWVMLLGGCGFGFFQTPNNRAMLIGSPPHRGGAAGALQATARVFGQSLGVALVAVAFKLGGGDGAFWAMITGICCVAGSLAVNVVRLGHVAPLSPSR